MSSFKLKKGINHCSNNDYHGDKNYLSSSNLKLLVKDLDKFKKEIIEGKKETKHIPAFDEGNYAHSLILEPEQIENEYAFYPNFRKSGKEWDAFKESNKGKIILSKPQKHRVESWVKSFNELPAAVNLIKGGKPEISLAGELNGVNIKVRADYINVEEGYIADVKTTGYSSDIDSFKFVIDSLMYDLSAALYCKMFSQHYGKKFDFYFIVLGKKDSTCEVYKASEKTLQGGELKVIEALKIYKECKKTGVWTKPKKSDKLNIDNYEILEI